MASLRQTRETLLLSHAIEVIDEEEFLLLYDVNKSKNPSYPYWNYDAFDLDSMTDDECKSEFRFLKNDVYLLEETLDIPDATMGLSATMGLLWMEWRRYASC